MSEETISLSQGFAVLGNCCSLSECHEVATQLEAIDTAGTRCLLDKHWCQILASKVRSRLVDKLPELDSLVAVQCTYFNKTASSNWFVAFHQDRSIPVASSVYANHWTGWSQKENMTFIQGPDELLGQMIAIRLYIDDSTLKNGPLRVLQGSHRHGTLTLEQIASLRGALPEQSLVMEAGGVVIMRPLLLHASSKSRTTSTRRVLHFLFGPKILPSGLEWRLGI